MTNFVQILLLSTTVFITGCSVIPVPYEIKGGHARVENWQPNPKDKVITHKMWAAKNIDENMYPYTKESLSALYVMCNNFAPRGFNIAYQHPVGAHKLWVKALFLKKQADVLFEVNLNEQGDYGFKHRLYKDRKNVDVWMIDLKTGLAISHIKKISLTSIPISRKKSYELWQLRCSQGSV